MGRRGPSDPGRVVSEDWKRFYAVVTIGPQLADDGPVQTHTFEPPTLDLSDLGVTIPEGAVVVLTEDGGYIVVPDGDG